jgi:hypothetical protein
MNMMDRLVAEIRQGGTLDTRRLASKLNTSPFMVEAMLDHLRRTGFLRSYESCSEGCTGCDLSASCSLEKKGSGTRLWQYVQEAGDQ